MEKIFGTYVDAYSESMDEVRQALKNTIKRITKLFK